MPNSTLLRSAIATYCHWAESVRAFDDLQRDDCALDEIRADARISRNALLTVNSAMGALFDSVCRPILSDSVYLDDVAVWDSGSGLSSDTGLPVIKGECSINNKPYPFTIDHDSNLTIDL